MRGPQVTTARTPSPSHLGLGVWGLVVEALGFWLGLPTLAASWTGLGGENFPFSLPAPPAGLGFRV